MCSIIERELAYHSAPLPHIGQHMKRAVLVWLKCFLV